MKKKIKVIKSVPDGEKSTRHYSQLINKVVRFGKEFKISPKATAIINEPGFSVEFHTETVNVVVGIGNDHTADLIMSKDAWEAFNNGDEISVTTVKEFVKSVNNNL